MVWPLLQYFSGREYNSRVGSEITFVLLDGRIARDNTPLVVVARACVVSGGRHNRSQKVRQHGIFHI